MSRSPPSNKMIFSWRVWFGLILERKLGKPPRSVSSVSLWPALGPCIHCFGHTADATKDPSAEVVLRPPGEESACPSWGASSWRRPFSGEGNTPQDPQTGKQDARACQQEDDSSLRIQSCFPLQQH